MENKLDRFQSILRTIRFILNITCKEINDPMINDLIEVTVDNPNKYDDSENIAFTIDLFAKAIHGGANRKIISYSKMEYKRTDWLRECIKKGE